MIENSTQGLTLLDADNDAEVVGTEHHTDALMRWAPGPDGRARRVAAELRVAGDDVQGRWIEVLLDGLPVGGLAPDAAFRHARHIEAVLERGGRPAANGLVRMGARGPQLELRLPDPSAPVRAPLPPAGPPAERPDASMWPRERRSPRTPLLIGGGVLALLLVVGMVVGGTTGGRPASTDDALRPTAVRTTTPVPTTTTPAPPPTSTVAPVAETRTPTTTRRAPRTTPRPVPTTTAAPVVTTTPPAPPVTPPPGPTTTTPSTATGDECPPEGPGPLFGDDAAPTCAPGAN